MCALQLARGQFVPQLTLGNGLCNGTGAPLYDCAPCDPNPKTSKQWYMQAQYFWEGHDPSELDVTTPRFLGRRGADADMCHVIAGPLIPIEPGQMITTKFSMDEDAVWHASISTGAKISAIKVPYEFMERNHPTAGCLMRSGPSVARCRRMTVSAARSVGSSRAPG